MPDKKFIVKSLLTAILTAIVLFLLNTWLNSFAEDMNEIKTDLKLAFEESTTAIKSLDGSVDDLRLQMTKTDALIVVKFENNDKKLDDHEIRIRELERK